MSDNAGLKSFGIESENAGYMFYDDRNHQHQLEIIVSYYNVQNKNA